MIKIISVLMILSMGLFAQQIKSTHGMNGSGDDYDGTGLTYIDTTAGTTNNIIIDLNDWYPFDINPLFSDDSVVIGNSTRLFIGTFYVTFDNQGTASPTTDSVTYTIKAYPAVAVDKAGSVASLDYGTAVTLETIEAINDYFAINNVYIHATKGKVIPPEFIKLEIAPIDRVTNGIDDSTYVNWMFRYPAIYNPYRYEKEDAGD